MDTKLDRCIFSFSSSSEDEDSNKIIKKIDNKQINLLSSPIICRLNTRSRNSSKNNLDKNEKLFLRHKYLKEKKFFQISHFSPQITNKNLYLIEKNYSKTGSLDRKLSDVKKLNFAEMKSRLKQQHEQLEKKICESNLKNNNNLNNQSINNINKKPPILPLHKCTWESKFYKIASTSINEIISNQLNSNDKTLNENSNEFSCNFYDESERDFFVLYKTLLFKYSKENNLILNLNEYTEYSFDEELDRICLDSNENSDFCSNDKNLNSLDEKNDYDLPPDVEINSNLNHIINQNNLNQRESVASYYNLLNSQVEPLEKSGYFLCGKKKKWKQRYFVLKKNCIYYYKSQTDAEKNKLKGKIFLNNDIKISRNENLRSFQIINNNGKIIYNLTADSVLTMEEWVRVIKNSLDHYKKESSFLNEQTLIEGWTLRRMNGYTNKVWLVLKSKQMIFYKHPSDTQPFLSINLNDVTIKDFSCYLENNCRLDEFSDQNNEYIFFFTSENNSFSPFYLIFTNEIIFNKWMYHFSIIFTEKSTSSTEFEKTVFKLMSIPVQENNYANLDSSSLWSEPIMVQNQNGLCQTLTDMDSSLILIKGIHLYLSINLFTKVKINISSGIEYHVSSAQGILDLVLENPKLQNEFFAQLIKQCSLPSLNKSLNVNNNEHITLQSFQLLSLAVSIFIAKGKILWLLKNFLRKSADDATETGKYAIYCQRALERCLQKGNRKCKPSRMEILGILIRNPYLHSLPYSIPVHFTDGNYVVVGLDGSTTIEEFVNLICEQTELRKISQSGFALFSDDPINSNEDHFLFWKHKLADIISRWETTLKINQPGKFENNRIIKLIFKNRIYLKPNNKNETEREKVLLAYQINENIVKGKFFINSEFANYLTILLTLYEFSNELNSETKKRVETKLLTKGLNKFYPKKFLKEDNSQLIDELIRLSDNLNELTKHDCIRIYLNCVKKWPLFSCKLFEAKFTKDSKSVYLAIDENLFHILEIDFKIINVYFLNKLINYSLDENHFYIEFFKCLDEEDDFIFDCQGTESINSLQTEKLCFEMNKSKSEEIMFLIRDYSNLEKEFKYDIYLNESNIISTKSNLSSTNESLSENFNFTDLESDKTDNGNNQILECKFNKFNCKEEEDYSEIYSSTYENNLELECNLQKNAPTPPLHQYLTWEKKLYDLSTCLYSSYLNDNKKLYNMYVKLKNSNSFKNHFRDSKENCNLSKLQNTLSTSSYQTKKLNSFISFFFKENYLHNNFINRHLSNDGSSSFSQYSLSKKSSTSKCNSDSSENSLSYTLNFKHGYYLILNKKSKWKKRYILFKNNEIILFKNKNDFNKKKSKSNFCLNQNTELVREENLILKLVNKENDASILFLFDTLDAQQEIFFFLLSILEKSDCKNLDKLSSILESWISIIQNGLSKKYWCKLKKNLIFFYIQPFDELAILTISLNDFNLEEVESNDYESNLQRTLFTFIKEEFIILLSSKTNNEKIYLVFNEKKDFDTWFYHLSILNIEENNNETPFELVLTKFLKTEVETGTTSLANSYLWNEPILSCDTKVFRLPVTKLNSSSLNLLSKKLFRLIKTFISVELDKSAIDYHVGLIQDCLEICLDYPKIQNEFYCHLICFINSSNNTPKLNQTESCLLNKKLISNRNSLFSSNKSICGNNHYTPNASNALLSMQLMAIAISLFVPKGKILWFIKIFLQRLSDKNTDIGKYSIYCLNALGRVLKNGNRRFKPSRMEILSILLRNPYNHSLPHSVPVYFLNKDYLVIGFDGSTTVKEFIYEAINQEDQLESFDTFEYGLYCDNPVKDNIHYFLDQNLKLADVISTWEICLRKRLGKFESNKLIKFYIKKRLYLKLEEESDSQKMLLIYKINEDIKNGKFPVNHQLAIIFAALLSEINFENYDCSNEDLLNKILEKYYPSYLKNKIHQAFLHHDLRAKLNEIRGSDHQKYIQVFLNCTQKWSMFGSSLFLCKTLKPLMVHLTLSNYTLPKDTFLWCAVNKFQISILEHENYQQIFQFDLKDLIYFGCHKNEFVLVAKKSFNEFDNLNKNLKPKLYQSNQLNEKFQTVEKFKFSMKLSEMNDLTLLIRDYLNAKNLSDMYLLLSKSS